MELISPKKETRESKCVEIGPCSLVGALQSFIIHSWPCLRRAQHLVPGSSNPTKHRGIFTSHLHLRKKTGEMMKDAKSIKIKQ